jgi:uncharacterized RDD family membrane protein YckC
MTMNTELTLATPQHRLAANAVDAGFYIATLGIGWLIWNLIMWGKGQTPGKQLLKIRVYGEVKNRPANWGHMLVRQLLLPGMLTFFFYIPYLIYIIGDGRYTFDAISGVGMFLLVASYVALLIIDIVWIFGPQRRRLLDYLSKTYVVNEAA